MVHLLLLYGMVLRKCNYVQPFDITSSSIHCVLCTVPYNRLD